MIYIYKFLNFLIKFIEGLVWFVKRKVLFHSLGSYGKNVNIGRWRNITPNTVYIGDNTSIGNGVIMQSTNSKIIIGSHVMFGPNVSIHGGNHRIDILGRYMKSISLSEKRIGIDDADVIVEDDVWVADSVIILKGVKIGKGSVIGAGTIIYKDVPPYSIVTGSKMELRPRFTEDQIIEHESMLCINKSQ